MKKKISTYSWIHELKESALEAKLLSEAKLFEQQMNPFEKKIQDAGGDVDTHRKILAQKKAKDLKPVDVDGDGDADAKDVELDTFDNVIGNERPFSGLPSFPWAHTDEIPPAIQHPDAPYTGGLTPNEITARGSLNLRRRMEADLARERAYEEDEYIRRDAVPTAQWRNVRENVEKELNRIIKTAPKGKIYSINELREIAKVLWNK
jgi:hypothetical protein